MKRFPPPNEPVVFDYEGNWRLYVPPAAEKPAPLKVVVKNPTELGFFFAIGAFLAGLLPWMILFVFGTIRLP